MDSSAVSVRAEQNSDHSAVQSVHTAAFRGDLEANLVDQRRESCAEYLSLVAVHGNAIVGHILFTPAHIESRGRTIAGWALAPMAVRPEFQRRNIGTLLVEAGLATLRQQQAAFVVVLGHPRYYPRFGFQPASLWKLHSEWDVPDEVFMILPLDEEALNGAAGVVRYQPEFRQAAQSE